MTIRYPHGPEHRVHPPGATYASAGPVPVWCPGKQQAAHVVIGDEFMTCSACRASQRRLGRHLALVYQGKRCPKELCCPFCAPLKKG